MDFVTVVEASKLAEAAKVAAKSSPTYAVIAATVRADEETVSASGDDVVSLRTRLLVALLSLFVDIH
jgi:hypothetical protein